MRRTKTPFGLEHSALREDYSYEGLAILFFGGFLHNFVDKSTQLHLLRKLFPNRLLHCSLCVIAKVCNFFTCEISSSVADHNYSIFIIAFVYPSKSQIENLSLV